MKTKYNIVMRFKIVIEYDDNSFKGYIDRCRHEIVKHMAMYDKIYSYYVQAIYDINNDLSKLEIVYLIAQTDEYNTLDVLSVITNICIAIGNMPLVSNKKRYICYGQPPLELLLILYEPLIESLTNKEYQHWGRYIEYEDAKQICYLVICQLYNNGYNINKKLLSIAYEHEILKVIGQYNNAPTIVSLDKLESIYGTDKHDVLADESAEQELIDTEQPHDELYKERKAQVLTIISERQYDVLVKEYTNKETSASSNALVYRLKEKIKKQNKGEDK